MERDSQPEQTLAMPLGMRFDLAISDAVPANRNIAQFLASNASDFNSSNNTIRINVSSGAFLDLKASVLQFELKNTTTTHTVQLDGQADCVINRIRVLSSDGSEIERIDSYNVMSSILDQYTTGDGAMRVNGVLKGAPQRMDDSPELDPVILASAAGSGTITAANGLTLAASAALGGNITVSNILGGVGYDHRQCDRLESGIIRKYSFPLKCGFFNPATSKLLPPNSPFQLEITLESSGAACLVNLGADTAPSFQVNNVELHCPAVTVNDPGFMARLNGRMSSGMSWKCNSYQHYVNVTGANTGKDVIQISARARSLKGLITLMRKQANLNANQKFKISKRSIQYVSDYQYKIGSNNYPVDRVAIVTSTVSSGTTSGARVRTAAGAGLEISEAYTHALRLTGNLNQSNADTLVGVEAFSQSEVNNGVGILAMDLSAFSDGSVNSGMNTLNNMPCSLEFTRANPITIDSGSVQVDTFSVNELVIIRLASGVLASTY